MSRHLCYLLLLVATSAAIPRGRGRGGGGGNPNQLVIVINKPNLPDIGKIFGKFGGFFRPVTAAVSSVGNKVRNFNPAALAAKFRPLLAAPVALAGAKAAVVRGVAGAVGPVVGGVKGVAGQLVGGVADIKKGLAVPIVAAGAAVSQGVADQKYALLRRLRGPGRGGGRGRPSGRPQRYRG